METLSTEGDVESQSSQSYPQNFARTLTYCESLWKTHSKLWKTFSRLWKTCVKLEETEIH
jgi:hypothetical protein